MSNPVRKNHLRLVSSRDAGEENSSYGLSGEVFSPDEAISLWMVSESIILRNDGFLPFLQASNIRCLFDVRIAPRLDFIAPNRALAFKKLSELNISYIDVIGAMGADSGLGVGAKPEAWAGLVSSKIRAPELLGTGAVFVFDNDEILKRAQYVLPSAIATFDGYRNLRVEDFPGSSSELIAM